MTSTNDGFNWGPLGESWWRENGEACRATETQIKYACSRSQGCTMVKSAELAGYSGTGDQLRSAGSRAEGTTGVDALMTLAKAAEAGTTDNPVTLAEVKKKIGKLVRSPDGGISLKASELFFKLDAADKQKGETPEDDGFLMWRLERDFLLQRNGAVAYVLMHGISNCHLLHDTYNLIKQQWFGPEVWAASYNGLTDDARKDLDAKLADRTWQLEARKTIWAEIGVDI